MQNVSSQLFSILEGSTDDLLPGNLFEFYPPEETNLCPANAERRFAGREIVWMGHKYERQAISHDDISRFIDERFNNVSVRLSNIDRSVAQWITLTADLLEGYRLVIRAISRSVDSDSIGMAALRCEPVQNVSNQLVQITAKQDLGSITTEMPPDKESPVCPLEFKSKRCLAGQSLGSKSLAYQAATVCDKSRQQCRGYDNEPAFQGEWFNGVSGNFRVSQPRGGAGGAALGLVGLRNKRVTKMYSSQDDSAIGTPTPLILGAAQLELTPIQSADTGEYLAGQWIVGAGEIEKLQNVHNISAGWATTFQAYAQHRGKFGFDSEQFPLGFFTSGDQRHSEKAWVEATIKGENPDTGDPAPTLVGRALGVKVPAWNGTSFGADAWSDNGIDHARWIITDERLLKYNPAWVDDVANGETANYCDEPLKDQTGGEDVYISTSVGTPGVDYLRFRSSGIIDTWYYRKKLGLTADYSAAREIEYNTFNPASPPSSPTIKTYYRKRYTSNVAIREKITAADFIFKVLLPAFRGYIVTSAQGKQQIRTEKPTVNSLIRNDLSIGATAIPVEDALAWRSLNLPVVFALVGVGLATSETRKVTSVDFSTAGNSITLSASGSATASGGTLSGGTSEIQAQGTVTVGSAASATVTIEGVPISYTANGNDTSGTVAGMLSTMINADETLNRFVKASWTPTLPNQVIIRSKLGLLNVAALEFAHDAAEAVAHCHMVFSDVAFGALDRGNIAQNGFEWPLATKNQTYNKFVSTYQSAPDDYQSLPVEEDDYAHQRKINKTSVREVSGGCIDNYHQARRNVVAERYKYREGNYFCSVASEDRRCLLLEEGDVFCVTHSNQPGQRNLMFRVEELKASEIHRVSITGRLYADAQFPQSARQRTVGLTTGTGWQSTPPGPVTDLVLVSDQPGAIHGTFAFAGFIGAQLAKIEVERAGTTGFVDTGLRILPDLTNNGTFDLSSLPEGFTSVRVTPVSVSSGLEGTATTGTVTVMGPLDYIIDLTADGLSLETVVEDDGSGILYE